MARRTISIDEKIERAKNSVSKAKEKYDKALDVLEALMEEKKKLQSEELLKAIESSEKIGETRTVFKTHSTILQF